MASDALSIMEMGHSQKPGPRFVYDEWLSMPDIGNNSGINVPIKFSTASMANSAIPIIWAEAEIVIPLTLTVQGSTFESPTQLAMAFKGPGYSSLIDRVLVSLNDKPINDQNAHVNTLINIRQLSGFSKAKVQQIGLTIGYEP